MAGRKALDSCEKRARRDEIPLKQVLGDILRSDCRPVARGEEDGACVRAECEASLRQSYVQRLLPQAISGEKQALALHIPDGESEHPVQMSYEVVSPLEVPVNEHLRVRLRLEFVPPSSELGVEGAVVPDLTVVDDDDRD